MSFLLGAFVALSAILDLASVSAQQVCNNAEALCSRTYDSVTHLGAHDAPFVRDKRNGFTPAGDQFFNTSALLSYGVRLLSAQAHNSDEGVHLCHSACELYNAGLMSDWLVDIREWLDANPNEVVSILIVNSDDNDASTFDGIFETAEISNYAHVPSSNVGPVTWPTLGELITSGKRLVVWIAGIDPATTTNAPYLLDEFSFIFENNYDITDPSGFPCDADRPSNVKGDPANALSKGLLPLLNHFLYTNFLGTGIEIPAVEHVDSTNKDSGDAGNFGDHANRCTSAYSRSPVLTLVDFANVGPAIDTVDRLNGVSGATVGRIGLPTDVAGSMLQSLK